MFDSMLETGDQLTISGDGRHDSMGHSATFGAYSLFCCNTSQIMHVSLVQVTIMLLEHWVLIKSCCGIVLIPTVYD